MLLFCAIYLLFILSIDISNIRLAAVRMLSVSMSKQTVALYNMLSEKQYADVITKGERLLKTNPEDAGIHLAIMDAHFKLRDESESHLVACADSARLAVLYGHNTGYAHDRLLKTLKALKQYHKAIQLCDLVLLDRFAFQAQGMGNKATFVKAREQFVKLLPKAADSESDILYDKDQISAILFRQQERLRLEQESKRVLDEAGKYIWTNEREYKRLMKQYHDLQSKLW